MTDLEDKFNLGQIVCDDNNQERKSWACLGTNLFQIADCVSVPTFCYSVDHLWMILENSPLKSCDESTVSLGILWSAAGYILPSPRL